MLRRHFNLAVCLLAWVPLARDAQSAPTASRGPLFWLITRGKARVFLLGFGDARDESWLTPTIRGALGAAAELWLEVAPSGKSSSNKAYEQLSHEPPGRTFFDELEPEVLERTLAYMAELGVTRESVQALRPWRAYYTINSAFWSRNKLPYEPVMPPEVLRKLAILQGKGIGYEVPTGLAFAQSMAAMSAKAQSQYIEWLLDFFDDYRKGFDGVSWFDWMTGSPTINRRSLDRMRTRTPELYQVMQVRRNAWWAHKINQLLATPGTRFIGIGELHVLGPDGIPSQLERLGIVEPSELHEDPSLEAIG